MSFAAASAKEDEPNESNLVKSLKSVWKKAKSRPSLPGKKDCIRQTAQWIKILLYKIPKNLCISTTSI